MPDNELKVRDPIHGFVTLDETEHKLLDTRAMQRLRGIRQLALANLVYPGALHTRFDHSLGVMHVAGRMAKRLFDEDAQKLLRRAALLHDVGHGPFSHVSEYALERYADRGKLPEAQKQEKIHELVTKSIVETDEEIHGVLGGRCCQHIASLLSSGLGEAALRSVLSGPLDADKQDYLLRDSHFCGVRYGMFDLEQLHRALDTCRQEKSRDLVIKRDSVHAVEQYVLAKYYMTANVYRHKVRLITDQMIVRAISLGIDVDEIEELRALYAYDGSEAFLNNYRDWNDDRFFEEFGGEKHQGKGCNTMLRRLRERKLLKRVFHTEVSGLSTRARDLLFRLDSLENREIRCKMEQAIGERTSSVFRTAIDKDLVILHAFSVGSVKDMARNDEAGIMVLCDAGAVYFDDASRLFASIQEGFKEQFVDVYAPVSWPSRETRDDLCSKLRGSVVEVIETACAGEGTDGSI